jgi:hypothetical protein
MATVQAYCHRAMLLHDGEMRYLGDPEEVGQRYMRLNFGGAAGAASVSEADAFPEQDARIVDGWFENAAGERIDNVEFGEPMRLSVVIEAQRELNGPVFGIHCNTIDGVHVFGFIRWLKVDEGEPDRLSAGQRVKITGTIENPLAPGRYRISCFVGRNHNPGNIALIAPRFLDFVVFGTTIVPGMVTVEGDIEAVPDDGAGP